MIILIFYDYFGVQIYFISTEVNHPLSMNIMPVISGSNLFPWTYKHILI
jgi:hypothetical protein